MAEAQQTVHLHLVDDASELLDKINKAIQDLDELDALRERVRSLEVRVALLEETRN